MKYEKIKFLVIALQESIEIYAWAPKPYHKFMAFKVRVSKVQGQTPLLSIHVIELIYQLNMNKMFWFRFAILTFNSIPYLVLSDFHCSLKYYVIVIEEIYRF